MRALVLDGALAYRTDLPAPAAPGGEALVRVRLAGICNTDLELARGYMGFRGVPGHEFVGVVDTAPGEGWTGRRVVGEINAACGECEACRGGNRRHCPQRTVLGILGRDGAFADFLTLPVANLHAVPEGLRDEEAIFVEPTAAAYEILEQLPAASPGRALVLGPGKLGLLVGQVLAAAGHEVLMLGRNPAATAAVRALGLPYAAVDDYRGPPAPLVVDCSGSARGFQQAAALTRPRGTLVLKSTVAESLPLNLAPLVINEIQLIGSRCGPFPPAIEALARGTVRTAPLLEEVLPLEQGLAAFEHAARPHALKVALQIS